MRLTIITIPALLALALSPPQDSDKQKSLTVTELRNQTVIGELGIPLGTAVEIKAEVVSGRELNMKGYDSLYLLKVTHVDGKKIDSLKPISFSIHPMGEADLASRALELYELKTGRKKTGSLGDSQVKELEKGYVGRKARLLVYEVGRFASFPRELPEDIPVWADFGFGFSNSLMVLAERK